MAGAAVELPNILMQTCRLHTMKVCLGQKQQVGWQKDHPPVPDDPDDGDHKQILNW